jgi:hypothetical protein
MRFELAGFRIRTAVDCHLSRSPETPLILFFLLFAMPFDDHSVEGARSFINNMVYE